MEFVLVSDSYKDKFEQKVNAKLADGWEPEGLVFYGQGEFCLAMSYTEPEAEPEVEEEEPAV